MQSSTAGVPRLYVFGDFSKPIVVRTVKSSIGLFGKSILLVASFNWLFARTGRFEFLSIDGDNKSTPSPPKSNNSFFTAMSAESALQQQSKFKTLYFCRAPGNITSSKEAGIARCFSGINGWHASSIALAHGTRWAMNLPLNLRKVAQDFDIGRVYLFCGALPATTKGKSN
jgi:hypothetical protein